MRLITDTNILIRCVRGRAFERVRALLGKGVELMVTTHNIDEMLHVLTREAVLAEADMLVATASVLRPFEVIEADVYLDLRETADRRLREGGKSDWPVLAAAMAIGCAIWSEDTDFFGTGVAVWSSANVLECASSTGKQNDA